MMALGGTVGAMETPPHTWRKCPRLCTKLSIRGNTSTYVEKIYAME